MTRIYSVLWIILSISLSIIGYHLVEEKSYAYSILPTTVGVRLIHSYSWSLTWSIGQNIVFSWSSLRTRQTINSVLVSASTWSSFRLTGDIWSMTGQWIWSYTIPMNILLSSGDGPKSLQSLFLKGSEPYDSTMLDILLDQTSPSLPTIIWPQNHVLLSGLILLSWTGSVDTGIGVSGYKIHISLDPWFLWKVVIASSWASLSILSSQLPQWTLFWYIEALDFLWNSIKTDPMFFHNGQPSLAPWWWSGYGWWDGYIMWYDTAGQNNIPHSIWATWAYDISWDDILWVERWDTITSDTIMSDNTSNNTITLRQILLNNYTNLSEKQQNIIFLPSQSETTLYHDSASLFPNVSLYTSLLWVYYHHLVPLWHTMNYISRLLVPLYYIKKWLQYLFYHLIRKKYQKKY
jgi:hypothetical protein